MLSPTWHVLQAFLGRYRLLLETGGKTPGTPEAAEITETVMLRASSCFVFNPMTSFIPRVHISLDPPTLTISCLPESAAVAHDLQTLQQVASSELT